MWKTSKRLRTLPGASRVEDALGDDGDAPYALSAALLLTFSVHVLQVASLRPQ